jgi:hypothetical protein
LIRFQEIFEEIISTWAGARKCSGFFFFRGADGSKDIRDPSLEPEGPLPES